MSAIQKNFAEFDTFSPLELEIIERCFKVFDTKKCPFLIVLQHPVETHMMVCGNAEDRVGMLTDALGQLREQLT